MSLSKEQRQKHWAGVRNPFWWVFCGPGAIMMEIQYWMPSKGNMWLSRRQYGNRWLQFLFTMVGYFIFFALYFSDGK